MSTPTQNEIDTARNILEAKWDSNGDCESCGWHASLGKHEVSDADISEALQDDGILRLGCQNPDADDAYLHRGVSVWIR